MTKLSYPQALGAIPWVLGATPWVLEAIPQVLAHYLGKWHRK